MRKMNRFLITLIVAALILGFAGTAVADNDSHSGTVNVQEVSGIDVSDAQIDLTINTATPGEYPDPAIDQTGYLLWTIMGQGTNKKITVTTTCLNQKFTLKVLAINLTIGDAAGEVTLTDGMSATSFILNVGKTSGSCNLKYTASATLTQGVGTDTHTVTYTVVAQ